MEEVVEILNLPTPPLDMDRFREAVEQARHEKCLSLDEVLALLQGDEGLPTREVKP